VLAGSGFSLVLVLIFGLIRGDLDHQFKILKIFSIATSNWPLARTRPRIEVGPKTWFIQVGVLNFLNYFLKN
jgi:hypothetical protein